jgi:hypothetical protein
VESAVPSVMYSSSSTPEDISADLLKSTEEITASTGHLSGCPHSRLHIFWPVKPEVCCIQARSLLYVLSSGNVRVLSSPMGNVGLPSEIHLVLYVLLSWS